MHTLKLIKTNAFLLAIGLCLSVPPTHAQAVQVATGLPSNPATQLTLEQAEQLALKNNPRISVQQLLALAQHQSLRETRSRWMPQLDGNITGVDANQASRISSGMLTSSQLLQHAGLGVELDQLITDFGRTHNLVASAKLQERADIANATATEQQILLATDYAFYNVLESQATLDIANQAVATRQQIADQIAALTKNKLKSDLDLSFADVNLSQAKLLQLDSQSNLQAAMNGLTAILGSDQQTQYRLIDPQLADATLALPTNDAESLVTRAMSQRPDLQSLQLAQQSAILYAHAQRDQLLPSLNALGIVGATPVGAATYYTPNWYGAIGVNVNIPIFNGFRFTAEYNEAKLIAQAAGERSRDLHNNIARDVRSAWLQSNTAYQKVSVSQELLKEADMGLQLAQTRYQLGLSSIVELSQAQLQQTGAAISNANARYEFAFSLATLRFQTGDRP